MKVVTLVTSETKKCDSLSEKPRTWHTTEVFGLGPAICNDDVTITGCRLPTCLQVLRCMLYHCHLAASTERPGSVGAAARFTTAKTVLHQNTGLYEKANIPMISQCRCCEKIIKLLDDNNKLHAISKDLRETSASEQKLFENPYMLAKTFQLWPPNVESLIKNEEDLLFLQSTKTDRAANFGPQDNVLAQKIGRRDRRSAAAAE